MADQRASKWALFSRRFSLSGPYALCEKSLEAFRIGTDPEQNDTQHHCQWCGRPFTPSLFTPLDPLLYRSSRYAFAGFFYTLACIAILLTGAPLYIIVYRPGIIPTSPDGGLVLLLCWGVAFVVWYPAFLGYRERTSNGRQQAATRNDGP